MKYLFLIGFFKLTFVFGQNMNKDLTFNGGDVWVPLPSSENISWPVDMEIQSDGKIISLSGYQTDDGNFLALARYHPDGTPDLTFGVNGFIATQINTQSVLMRDLAIQSDGRILIYGEVTGMGVTLIRLNSDGTFDNSFEVDGILTLSLGNPSSAQTMMLDQNENILLCGTIYNTSYDFFVTKVDSDGILDNSFGIGGTSIIGSTEDEILSAATVLPDDRILLAGTVENTLTSTYDLFYTRLHSNGNIDNSFGAGGFLSHTYSGDYQGAKDIVLLSDTSFTVLVDHIVTIGVTNFMDIGLYKYLPDGSFDNSFGVNGFVSFKLNDNSSNSNEFGFDLQSDPDGNYYVAGRNSLINLDESNLLVIRFLENGSLDLSFDQDGYYLENFDFAENLAGNIKLIGINELYLHTRTSNGYAPFYQVGISNYLIDGFLNISNITDPITEISVYPNPTKELLNVYFGIESNIQNIHVFNSTGERIMILENIESETSSAILNFHDLPDGVYFIALIDVKGNTVSKKIIKSS